MNENLGHEKFIQAANSRGVCEDNKNAKKFYGYF